MLLEKTQAWQRFESGEWMEKIDVADFIRRNRSEYTGDDQFLAGPTDATNTLWQQIMQLTEEERIRGGVYAVDAATPSSILSHGPGYLNPELEKIVGLQTDEPFKRSIHPNGGIRMVNDALEAYGFKSDDTVTQIFSEYRKTHNQGVFDAYTPEMRAARKAGIITG
ncbi:MAG: pyruvate formate lyase family protein, partial [Exiguobacterium oxidotolerans]